MNTPYLLVAMCLLSGCCNLTPEIRTVEVMVPVAVPCKIEPIDKPVFAVDTLQIGAPIDEQMRALRSEREQRKGYEGRLEAAVQTCQ